MNNTIELIPLDQIEPHPGNRRIGGFDEAKLAQLADSIKAVGVQQPAVVRMIDPGNGAPARFQLVAGESPGRTTYGVVRKEERYQRSPEEKAKLKKERDAARAADEKRIEKVMAILEAAGSKGMPAEALRVCVLKVWNRWWHDHKVLVAKTEGWIKKNAEADSEGEKRIEAMDEDQLHRMLLLIAMSDEIKTGAYYREEKPKTITALEKVYSISTISPAKKPPKKKKK